MEMTPSDLIGEASRRSKKIWQEEWEHSSSPNASNKKHNRKWQAWKNFIRRDHSLTGTIWMEHHCQDPNIATHN
jgi:hypothetical protein